MDDIEFIDENGGGPGGRLRNQQLKKACNRQNDNLRTRQPALGNLKCRVYPIEFIDAAPVARSHRGGPVTP